MIRLFHIARTTAVAGLVFGSIALSAPALAADGDALPHGALVISGTDFTSPDAVARLKRKLNRIAKDICGAQSSGGIIMSRSEQACYDTAVTDGLAQIDSRQQQAIRDRTVRLADSPANDPSAQ